MTTKPLNFLILYTFKTEYSYICRLISMIIVFYLWLQNTRGMKHIAKRVIVKTTFKQTKMKKQTDITYISDSLYSVY